MESRWWGRDFNFLGFWSLAQRASVLSSLPQCLVWAAAPGSPSGNCGGEAQAQLLQFPDELGRGGHRFSRQLCPIAAAEGRKYVLNGEVAARNTRLRNKVGKIHQAAGLWGGDLQGWHMRTTLSFVPLAWRQWWLPAGATLWAAFPFPIASLLFHHLCNGFPTFSSLYLKHLKWLLFSCWTLKSTEVRPLVQDQRACLWHPSSASSAPSPFGDLPSSPSLCASFLLLCGELSGNVVNLRNFIS